MEDINKLNPLEAESIIDSFRQGTVPAMHQELYLLGRNRNYLSAIIQDFPNIGSISYQLSYSDEQHDRIDACLFLGGDTSTISTTNATYEKFKQGAKNAVDWEIYGLTRERIAEAERTLDSYDKKAT